MKRMTDLWFWTNFVEEKSWNDSWCIDDAELRRRRRAMMNSTVAEAADDDDESHKIWWIITSVFFLWLQKCWNSFCGATKRETSLGRDETRRDELRGADERCDQLVKVSLPRWWWSCVLCSVPYSKTVWKEIRKVLCSSSPPSPSPPSFSRLDLDSLSVCYAVTDLPLPLASRCSDWSDRSLAPPSPPQPRPINCTGLSLPSPERRLTD